MNFPSIVQVNTQIPSALEVYHQRRQEREQTAYRQHQMDVGDQELNLRAQETQQRGELLKQKADELAATVKQQQDQKNAIELYGALDGAIGPDGKITEQGQASIANVIRSHGGTDEYAQTMLVDISAHPEMAKTYKSMTGYAAFGEKYAEMSKPGKLSAPQAAMDDSGKRVFMQTDEQGNASAVKGFAPTPPKPIVPKKTWAVGPDGKPTRMTDEEIDASGAQPYQQPKGTNTPQLAIKLRAEFTKSIGKFDEVNDSFGRILASATDPSAAGDLALIFNYMKVLDPGSTVRETEFANAENAGSVDERVRAQFNKVKKGERLSANQRADFLTRAKKLYGEAAANYKKREENFTPIVKKAGVDPADVFYGRDLYDTDAKNGLPEGATEADVQHTMQEMHMTRDQVLQALNAS